MLYDFSGYATKTDLLCSDGRTICPGSFDHQDGARVPLVWHHLRDDIENVLGHADLEKRDDGIYAYCKFNDTPKGQIAKTAVEHGDLTNLSIYANKLKQKGNAVVHGMIREVSLVMAGANPGAFIDNLAVEHSDGSTQTLIDEGVIYNDDDTMIHNEPIEHGENQNDVEHADTDDGGKDMKAIFNSMTEDQKDLMYAVIAHITGDDGEEDDDEDAEHSDSSDNDNEGGNNIMKKNVFEDQDNKNDSLSHEDVMIAVEDAKRNGSMKHSFIEHGITDIEFLFPDPKLVRNTPDMIMRDQEWVAKVWGGAHKSPFSRIKSMAANLTEAEARAKGYIKGKKKLEEQFGLLKRTTTPQTVYKKQALDRDDIIDITDFNVVAWLKQEMRLMLNEELARAVLVGDGRPSSSDDKINPLNIRPIYLDDDLYSIHYEVEFATNADNTDKTNSIIDAANYARIDYKGSGSPTLYTTSRTLTTMLLAKDKIGRRLYNSVSELASALRVRDIVEVPVMENMTRTDDDSNKFELIGIIVNMNDYTVGADKGGAISFFDDFDIDFNKEKYLIETRCSGALTLPYSAIVLESLVTTTPITPPPPSEGGDDEGDAVG